MDVWAEHLPEHLTQHLLGKGERPELFLFLICSIQNKCVYFNGFLKFIISNFQN